MASGGRGEVSARRMIWSVERTWSVVKGSIAGRGEEERGQQCGEV